MILTGLAVGVVFGAVLQRGRFCVTGMMRDIFLNRTWRGMVALLILISVHSIGLTALVQLGVLSPGVDEFAPIGVILGGFIFGLGIILAGGCASGTWYRSAEGLVGSWIALLFYGLSAAAMKYGFLHSLNSSAKKWTLPVTTIPEALGISPWVFVALTVAGTFALWRHYAIKDAHTPSYALDAPWYQRPLSANVAGALIGVIGTVAFVLSAASGRNSGLGITTPSADIINFTATGDPDRVNWGTLLVIGLLLGAYLAAKATGEFRIRVPDASTAVRAIFGGSFMGVGAALAGGCTVGNGMVETSLFSFQGWVSLVFMTLGVGVGAKLWLRKQPVAVEQIDTVSSSDAIPGLSIPQVTGLVGVTTKKPSQPVQMDTTQVDAPAGGRVFKLDTLGAVCPFPLIEAKQAIAILEPGDSLVIDFDCTQATDSIPTWAADEGHVISDFQRVGDAGWQVTVVKNPSELKAVLV
ncbi:membrane protein [Corynebacterium phocae]|uniref:Membrane protein n=1 Tax=Corynebacterium phocae TaxID=161895 RepID=A0A1L7D4G8_9CORY|nr:YeeE/YedE thiosulfate transporter family protein [Corynebacterium phocae]APT93010.1 membrane protein [Corynebacterium phocae]KAA8722497.1 hypothetical protein F4V58_08555 [Corynebacterium phocae]